MAHGYIPDEAPLPTDFAEYAMELMRRVQAEHALLDAQELEDRAEEERADEERAERARSGELGPEWRTVQQRIDLHQTTLEDVFSGADETTAAQTLRGRARDNLSQLRELWEEQEDEAEEPTPLDILNGARGESAAHLRAAAERIQTVIADVQRRRDEGNLA
ncbi:hypothetical protein [Microbacterium sp. H83]|uniref:hypothetical protein n=1 Tax=Microbacterium sp. H83 TaxID=1827324 RepID=UPI0007F336AD|nr:hypothetical protein [Microbacterium sp. H83]OAN40991.1 hypothetical protein A4X16_02340 [Microbacterium sp. H83]